MSAAWFNGRVVERMIHTASARPSTIAAPTRAITVARVLDDSVREIGRRAAELEADRAQVKAILTGMIEGVLVVSGDGRLQLVNGSEVGTFPGNPARWYQVQVQNNIIVDNVAGWDGGGVSLQDALRVNFVNNSVKFTERGEIRLNIDLLERTGEKVQLRFSVRDTGIGMTPEQSARMFQPFSQADGSTTRRYGGTGLGLTICKRLVEMMQGRIGFDDRPGGGTIFWFELPRH